MSSDGKSQNIADLTHLQTLEKELLEKLQNPNTSDEEKTNIIGKIGDLTQLRIQLYQMLQRIDNDQTQITNQSDQLINYQLRSVKLVEDTLNKSKLQLQKLQSQRMEKLRVIEINNYYSKMYQAHTVILKWIIAWVIILAVCFYFYNPITIVLAVIASVYFSIKVGYLVLDTSNRSTQNFDQYDWAFDPNSAPSAPIPSSDDFTKNASSTSSKCTLF